MTARFEAERHMLIVGREPSTVIKISRGKATKGGMRHGRQMRHHRRVSVGAGDEGILCYNMRHDLSRQLWH